MTLQSEVQLDEIGWQILQALEKNARITFRDLGRQIGLSAPAVAERVRKMEDAGIIRGYHLELDLAKIGLPLSAFLRINVPKDMRTYMSEQLQAMPEVLECYRVAGTDSFIMRVCASSITDLEKVIDRLGRYGQSTTSIILSTVKNRSAEWGKLVE